MSSKRSTRRRVVVHAEAQLELSEARDFYDRETQGLGLIFIEAVEREFALLQEFPLIGIKHVRGTRRRTMPRAWPYSIIYQPILGAIYVIALAHHSRRPYYWAERARRG